MFEGQPKGLFALALANTGERFGYYTMLAVSTDCRPLWQALSTARFSC